MSSALDIINGSLKKLGVLSQGETPSSEEASDSLRALNSMLDSWSTQNLLMLGTVIEEFPTVASQNSYTIGSGGDFDTTVPIKTNSAYIKYTDGTERILRVIDSKMWGRISLKSIESIPDSIYIDDNYPLRKIYLYPTPQEVYTLILHNYRQIASIDSLTTTINFPKGYKRAIEFNLCIELASEYGKSITPEINKVAMESLSNIKRVNSKITEVGIDPFLSKKKSYDWRTGE